MLQDLCKVRPLDSVTCFVDLKNKINFGGVYISYSNKQS
jgi:hypothetical protein